MKESFLMITDYLMLGGYCYGSTPNTIQHVISLSLPTGIIGFKLYGHVSSSAVTCTVFFHLIM